MQAPETLVTRMKINTQDVEFEAGEFVSRWLDSGQAETTVGETAGTASQRLNATSRTDLQKFGVTLSFPYRVQIDLEEDGRKLAVLVMALPSPWANRANNYPHLQGEGYW